MRLQIEKLVYGGAGLSHQTEGTETGKAVFVPFTLPGEVVEAKLSAEKSGFGEATLVEVLEASPERIAARCKHFGACGGCQLQHTTYSAQLETKAEVLRETLERAGLATLPEIRVHAEEPWGYRNRIRLRVERVEGDFRAGYNRRGGNEFLAVQECPIAAPLLWRAASALLSLSAEDATVARWLHTVVEVEFFANGDETKLQMTVFVRKPLSTGFEALCNLVQGRVPELLGAGVSILENASAGRARRAERPVAGAQWGAAGFLYTAASRKYWVSRGGFFQVNRFLVDEMVRVVTEGRKGGLAWDLYAGVGLFSRALAKAFDQVVAVEGGETAAGDLAQDLKGGGMRAVHASTLEFLQAAVIQRERPELIVMDPPRAGAGADVCALLARLKVADIVYVSCDPVTLARDLRSLVDVGYTLTELHLVDMFPQTFHIETIVILRR